MTNQEYNALPYVNKSTLWEMRKSPLHYWHLMHDTPKKDTPAMKLGRAVHSRFLTPDQFDDEFAVAPDCDRRTKEGKAIWAELMESGKEVISTEDWTTIQGMQAEFPFGMLHNAHTELPLIWTDSETGVMCKGRLDAITDDYVIDYKTTSDASTNGFVNEAIRYGYDLQAAMYLEAARENGYKPKGFIFIAQEKTAPYLVNILHAGDAFLDRGVWIMRDLLTKYKKCKAENYWPGYGENYMILPEWVVIDDE